MSAPKPVVVQTPVVIQSGDLLLIPTKQSIAFTISWKQDGKLRREKYHLVQSYYSASSEFAEGKRPSTVTLWIADVYYEERFSEIDPVLLNISNTRMNIHYNPNVEQPVNNPKVPSPFAPIGTKGNWLKTQVDDRFWYGQDSAKTPKHKWVVYHPDDWKPKQANFLKGSYEALVAEAFPAAVKAVSSKGLKAVDVTGLLAAGLTKSGLAEALTQSLNSWTNDTFGHPLRQFGSALPNITDADLKNEQDAYNLAITTALVAVQGKLPNVDPAQKNIIANIIVALDEGILEEVPDEGEHNIPY